MRTLAALLLLFAIGCGGGAKPVDEDEFRGFLGKNISEVTARMGQPDRHSPGGMGWSDRVKKKAGGTWKRAYLSYNLDNMLVVDAGVEDD